MKKQTQTILAIGICLVCVGLANFALSETHKNWSMCDEGISSIKFASQYGYGMNFQSEAQANFVIEQMNRELEPCGMKILIN